MPRINLPAMLASLIFGLLYKLATKSGPPTLCKAVCSHEHACVYRKLPVLSITRIWTWGAAHLPAWRRTPRISDQHCCGEHSFHSSGSPAESCARCIVKASHHSAMFKGRMCLNPHQDMQTHMCSDLINAVTIKVATFRLQQWLGNGGSGGSLQAASVAGLPESTGLHGSAPSEYHAHTRNDACQPTECAYVCPHASRACHRQVPGKVYSLHAAAVIQSMQVQGGKKR